MRRTLTGLCWIAALALPHAGFAVEDPKNLPPELAAEEKKGEDLERIDGQLRRGEWAAAEAAARTLVDDALVRKSSTFSALARLALAEAGQGRTEEALWHWSIAQTLQVPFDPKPFGPPGELLASHPVRTLGEVPAGLSVRRPGDAGPAFSPPRLLEAKKVELPEVWGATPTGMHLQVIVNPEGRAELPVVTQSTSQAVTYVVLSSLREWRFEPARAGETPVAALFDISFPARRPLTEIANLKWSPLEKPEATLRAGRYQEASRQVGKVWEDAGYARALPSRGFLGVALAFKALAQAGLGETDGAICRWQAAQTLEPHLYGADLSAYGAAGKLLEEHPWGEILSPPQPEQKDAGSGDMVHRPEILKRPPPNFPPNLKLGGEHGKFLVESTITKTGTVRNLVLFSHGASPGFEASALDSLCDWRFKPATFKGEPVMVRYSLTMEFDIRR
jgi:protein TonB